MGKFLILFHFTQLSIDPGGSEKIDQSAVVKSGAKSGIFPFWSRGTSLFQNALAEEKILPGYSNINRYMIVCD